MRLPQINCGIPYNKYTPEKITAALGDSFCACSIKHNIQASFEPTKVATIKQQHHKITLGDFYGIWMQCLAGTIKINSTIVNSLCVPMETRKTDLLQN